MSTDGRDHRMDVIRHRGSVVLIPSRRRAVILIRQYRHVIRRWIWELPAGTSMPGERPDRAARRECEEEIGLRPTRLTRLGAYYPTPGFCDERMVFYAVPWPGDARGGRPSRTTDEQIEPRTFTMAQAWALVRSGAIVDMKTVLGLAMLDESRPESAPRTPRPPASPSQARLNRGRGRRARGADLGFARGRLQRERQHLVHLGDVVHGQTLAAALASGLRGCCARSASAG